MKLLKKILKWFLIILVIINLVIIISGKTYIYKGAANTYLVGRTGPDIDEYKIFPIREIKSGNPLPIANGKNYNKQTINTKSFGPYGTVAYIIIKNDSVIHEQY